MLNWDDPLGVTENNDKTPAAVIARPETLSEPQAAYVAETLPKPGTFQPGDGLQSNDALMATAGAAPSVNPDPGPVVGGGRATNRPMNGPMQGSSMTQKRSALPGWETLSGAQNESASMTSGSLIAGQT